MADSKDKGPDEVQRKGDEDTKDANDVEEPRFSPEEEAVSRFPWR